MQKSPIMRGFLFGVASGVVLTASLFLTSSSYCEERWSKQIRTMNKGIFMREGRNVSSPDLGPFVESLSPYLNKSVEGLSATDRNKAWCPNAECSDTRTCKPCGRRFLFEVSSGRSGSTSLMHMIGALPHVRMAGENYNTLGAIKRLEDHLETIRGLHNERTGAWQHHKVAKSTLSCTAQHIMETINPPEFDSLNTSLGELNESKTILGYKTVRFTPHEGRNWKDVPESVEFVVRAFPCSRIIVNICSNATQQLISRKGMGWHTKKSEVESQTRDLQRVAQMFGPHRAYLLDSSEWTASPANGTRIINEMVEWLGFRNCRFHRLAHDNANSYSLDRTVIDLGPNCYLPD